MAVGPTRRLCYELTGARLRRHPLTHKQVLKADGSTDALPLPPICVTALRIAKQNRDAARADGWPVKCICGEEHRLVFTTRTGRAVEPRNINRAFEWRRPGCPSRSSASGRGTTTPRSR
jgi:hypothetical protein